MVELNPQALLAALEANHAHKADPGRKGCGIEKAIRAYLSALPAPDDGLEVVATAWKFMGERHIDFAVALDKREIEQGRVTEIEPLVRLSVAQAALQTKDEQIERLTRTLDGTNAQLTEQFELSTEYVAKWQAAEQQVQKLTAENERLREALRLALSKMDDWNQEGPTIRQLRSALETQEASNMPAATIRPEVKSEREILKRLAAGDEIAFSYDGDDAFFTKGDRAFVGRVIISMRSKGYIKRIVLDDENYRGLSERDVISDAGLAALETQEGGK